MTRFRPCIDLHQGRVKQIVGGTLTDGPEPPVTHFVSESPSHYYANLYREDSLSGGHVIMLGPGNQEAALSALQAYPGGMQIGGGMTPANAASFLQAGASHIIVTSYLFVGDQFSMQRLQELSHEVGPERLVVDLSCRKLPHGYFVATNRWQTVTKQAIDFEFLQTIAPYCAEFLIHAADVEGQSGGMDLALIRHLGNISPLPSTYAGGAQSVQDLESVQQASQGKVDLTIGSALDIFGGDKVRYRDCVAFNRRKSSL